MSGLQTTIPVGSWVLVTGATGHIAAHVTKFLLERGYKVRGTVRDIPSAGWLAEGVFKPFADNGHIELVHVPDMGVQNAFADAIKGVSAIVHIASVLSFSEDPKEVVSPVVDSLVAILETASKEPSVKALVYTSSIAAAVNIDPGAPAVHAGRDSWNTKAVDIAWSSTPHPADYGHMVYQASKVQAEQALWAFVEREKPNFTVNVVSPSTVLGQTLHGKHLMSPYPWIKNMFEGHREVGERFQAIIHVDVKDVALLHVAAVLDPDCNGARLQAWAEYCNMNDILAVLRKLYPQRKMMEDFDNQTKLAVTADTDQSLALLKKWGQQNGWTSLEQSVKEEMDGVLKWFPEHI